MKIHSGRETYMTPSQLYYGKILSAGLLLFGLSIALSKSANNVLIGFVYISLIFFVARDHDVRSAVIRKARQPLLFPILVYFSVVVLGLLFTENQKDGIEIFNKTSGLLLVYWMTSALLDSVEAEEARDGLAERLLLFFLIGIAALDSIGFMAYAGLIGNEQYVLPLAPLHVHHIWFSNLNSLGMYIAAGFLLFSPLRNDTAKRIFLLAFLLLGGISVLLSMSRTAWIGMFVTAGILSYIFTRKKTIFFATLTGMIIAIMLLYSITTVVSDRINLIASDIGKFAAGETYTSLGGRFLMWQAAWKMFLSNPLVGVGTGDYGSAMAAYVRQGMFPEFLLEFNQPHNTYLFAMATNGLLGLMALVFLYYRGLQFVRPAMHANGRERVLAFAAVATIVHFMIAGITDSFLNIQILRYAFAFILGVCVRNSVVKVP